MNNKIALKLTLYFSAVLLVFALIIGGVFYQFFKQQTVEIKEKEMRLRAEKIAEVLSDNMARMESRHGDGIANSKFISYLDNVTQEIVWVVDSNRQLSINKDRVQRQRREVQKHHEHSGFTLFKRQMPPISWKEPPKTPKEAYERLPVRVKKKVEAGFAGKEFILEEYNPMLDGIMLTVGRPIYDSQGQVKAVLLLHSPVAGLRDAIWSGLRILLISLLVAMVLGMLLSVVLSWRFTGTIEKMKNIAERLAERDYSVIWPARRARSARATLQSACRSAAMTKSASWRIRWIFWRSVWSWQMPKAGSWKSCAVSLLPTFRMSCVRP